MVTSGRDRSGDIGKRKNLKMRFGMHRGRLGEQNTIRERSGKIGREKDAIRERSGEILRGKKTRFGRDRERLGEKMRFGMHRERLGEKKGAIHSGKKDRVRVGENKCLIRERSGAIDWERKNMFRDASGEIRREKTRFGRDWVRVGEKKVRLGKIGSNWERQKGDSGCICRDSERKK